MEAVMNRRDRCYVVGRRASKIEGRRAAKAWESLARQLEAMGDKDVPKFYDLLVAIRAANLVAVRLIPKEIIQ